MKKRAWSSGKTGKPSSIRSSALQPLPSRRSGDAILENENTVIEWLAADCAVSARFPGLA